MESIQRIHRMQKKQQIEKVCIFITLNLANNKHFKEKILQQTIQLQQSEIECLKVQLVKATTQIEKGAAATAQSNENTQPYF